MDNGMHCPHFQFQIKQLILRIELIDWLFILLDLCVECSLSPLSCKPIPFLFIDLRLWLLKLFTDPYQLSTLTLKELLFLQSLLTRKLFWPINESPNEIPGQIYEANPSINRQQKKPNQRHTFQHIHRHWRLARIRSTTVFGQPYVRNESRCTPHR